MIEGIKKIREAFRRITEGFRKEQKETQTNENEKELPEKEVVFADGEHPVVVPGVITQKEKTSDGWLVYGTRGKVHPKVIEVKICKDKREARKQKRRMYNKGNNIEKMQGMPLKRFIAKEKARKNQCPIRTQ